MDSTFSKVGYDPAANSQVTRKAPSAGGATEGGGGAVGGGLPRMDLSTLLEKVRIDICTVCSFVSNIIFIAQGTSC